MSIKQNVLANYIGQIYVTIISIVMLPVYLHYLGREAYGLVGFFGVLTGWLVLLDLGFTPALGREVARYRGGGIDAGEFRSLNRAMMLLYSGIAILITGSIILSSDLIAKHWLKVQEIPINDVGFAVSLMGLVFGLRWPTGVFRSVIAGFERQVWLNVINILVSTFRFVGVILIFNLFGATIRVFFTYQAFIAMVELTILAFVSRQLLPKWPSNYLRTMTLKPLLKIWHFAFSVAFLSAVWMLITQTDKLILSKLLPLSEYACYAIAVTAANGITLLVGPITQAILPRLTRFTAEKDKIGLQTLYRKATRLTCVIAGSATAVFFVFGHDLLWAWIGDETIATKDVPILSLYALGNLILAISAMQYHLQYAHGDLRLHIRGFTVFPLILVPSIIWATTHYGMIGAGFVWVFSNLLFLFGWTPFVHRKFLPGMHLTWLTKDIAPTIFVLLLMIFL